MPPQHREMLASRQPQVQFAAQPGVCVALFAIVMVLSTIFSGHLAEATDEKWKAEMIADTELAAPPAVTKTATIYGWSSNGERVLLREGSGPYTCVASGAFSTRLGKPPLPYPDPMCMDQNAWAFFLAIWAEKNPFKPEKPYSTAPGLVWMLAGMSVKKGVVAIGKSDTAVVKATMGEDGGEMFQISKVTGE